MLIVRRERLDDRARVREIQADAFRAPRFRERTDAAEVGEALLLDALRVSDGWIDRCSLVAELDGVLVGHNVCTRGHVADVPALGLGPIAVHPAAQAAGVGSALMHAMLATADALDEPLVALLGAPAYYHRFGFVTSTSVGVDPPDPSWGEHFMVRPLAAHRPSITGTFEYAEPFSRSWT